MRSIVNKKLNLFYFQPPYKNAHNFIRLVMKKVLSIAVLCLTSIIGCSQKSETHVIMPSDLVDFSSTSLTTQSGYDYGIINISTDKGNSCHFMIEEEQFINNDYRLQSEGRNNLNLSVNCNWNDQYYNQSKKFKTYAKISLTNEHENDGEGTLRFSFKLANAANNKYVEINNFSIQISDEFIKRLLDAHKSVDNSVQPSEINKFN